MSIKEELLSRSESKCELCSSVDNLSVYEVVPSNGSVEQSILVCSTCKEQLQDSSKMDTNHWHCLNDTMWSEHSAVQVVAYRVLKSIAYEGWPQDLLDSLYLEDDVQIWADTTENNLNEVVVKDSNGVTLQAGDSVTVIKDLDVKGASFTAKRGTVVKGISLNGVEGQIEGRVNGTKIVLLSKFLKKS
ncbi:MAG: PhnA domain-containing protein [Campylobacterota bacterium]|nr:PhnA domain-containing protein [Campylobacterota bacterium]